MTVVESYESAHTNHVLSEKVFELLSITTKPMRIDSMSKYCYVALAHASLLPRMPRKGKRESIWVTEAHTNLLNSNSLCYAFIDSYSIFACWTARLYD